MFTMRIAYFFNEEWEREFVGSRLPDHTFDFFQGAVRGEGIPDPSVEVLCIFANSRVDSAVLDRFPSVRIVATRSTGFDHIDLEETNKRGIVVVNVPTYGEHTVAEFAMALLLALSRRICDAHRRVETTGSFSQEGLRGFDLKGKTIGIVGTGHIGAHMIRLARGFDMNVVAYDAYQKADLEAEFGFRYVSLDELLACADIISLHAPYNEQTHHLINAENISRIKRGAYLINTARGGLVDSMALAKALEAGIIAGAGLDVIEEEGHMEDEVGLIVMEHPNEARLRALLANHYFIRHPRVILTAHIAFNTEEAIERILSTTVENIKDFVGGTPKNVVTHAR